LAFAQFFGHFGEFLSLGRIPIAFFSSACFLAGSHSSELANRLAAISQLLLLAI
jgi:hypothetical protein